MSSVFISQLDTLGKCRESVGALYADRQHSLLRISTERWQHMAHWKIHQTGKPLCFPHIIPAIGPKTSNEKGVCMCSSWTLARVGWWRCISPQTTEPDTWRTWRRYYIQYVRAGARRGFILTIIQYTSATTYLAPSINHWESFQEFVN